MRTSRIEPQNSAPAEELLEELVVEEDLPVAPLHRLGVTEGARAAPSLFSALGRVVQPGDELAQRLVLCQGTASCHLASVSDMGSIFPVRPTLPSLGSTG